MGDELVLITCIIWGVKLEWIKNDDLEPNTLVIQCYEHWEHMLIDMESTTLSFKRSEYHLVELWELGWFKS